MILLRVPRFQKCLIKSSFTLDSFFSLHALTLNTTSAKNPLERERIISFNMPATTIALVTLVFLGQSFVPPVECTSFPAQAQVIDQRAFNVLNATQPPTEFSAKSVSN